MTKKFTHLERKQIQQAVLESEIQGENMDETKAHAEKKIGGKPISMRYIYYVKAHSKERSHKRLATLKKHRHAYLDAQFRHIEEIEANQQFLYELRRKHPDKPFLQKTCTDSIVEMTIIKANFYAQLPDLSGSDISEDIFQDDTAKPESLEKGPPTKF